MINFSTGSIIIVSFPGATGVKRRPAVIVSSDVYHKTRPDIICAVITSKVDKATDPTDYILQDWSGSGLHCKSAFRSFVVTIEPRNIISVIGNISERDWKEIEARLKITFNLSC